MYIYILRIYFVYIGIYIYEFPCPGTLQLLLVTFTSRAVFGFTWAQQQHHTYIFVPTITSTFFLVHTSILWSTSKHFSIVEESATYYTTIISYVQRGQTFIMKAYSSDSFGSHPDHFLVVGVINLALVHSLYTPEYIENQDGHY